MAVQLRCRDLKFGGLTFQERLSRLEEILTCLMEEIALLKRMSYENTVVLQQQGTEFRGCDGELLLRNRFNEYRALLDEWFVALQTEMRFVGFDPSSQLRIGEFGMDLDGKFFAFRNDVNSGERLILLASENGFWIRDQNGNWGKLIRRPDDVLVFQEA